MGINPTIAICIGLIASITCISITTKHISALYRNTTNSFVYFWQSFKIVFKPHYITNINNEVEYVIYDIYINDSFIKTTNPLLIVSPMHQNLERIQIMKHITNNYFNNSKSVSFHTTKEVQVYIRDKDLISTHKNLSDTFDSEPYYVSLT
jgi:hypothetical protein